MPTYEYRCKDCGLVEDYLVKMGEEPAGCKKCDSDRLEKRVSAPNIGSSGNSSVESIFGESLGELKSSRKICRDLDGLRVSCEKSVYEKGVQISAEIESR